MEPKEFQSMSFNCICHKLIFGHLWLVMILCRRYNSPPPPPTHTQKVAPLLSKSVLVAFSGVYVAFSLWTVLVYIWLVCSAFPGLLLRFLCSAFSKFMLFLDCVFDFEAVTSLLFLDNNVYGDSS